MEGFCLSTNQKQDFAKRVIDNLNKEEFQLAGSNDKNTSQRVEDAILAIGELAAIEIHDISGKDNDKALNMLNNPLQFVPYLKSTLKVDVPEEKYEDAVKHLEELKSTCIGANTSSIITTFTYPTGDTEAENRINLTIGPCEADGTIRVLRHKSKDGQNQHVSIFIKEPNKASVQSAQDKTISRIEAIQNIKLENKEKEIEYVDGERIGEKEFISTYDKIPENAIATGRSYKIYDGKRIFVRTVTSEVNPPKRFEGPRLAGPIGVYADFIGRLVLRRDSLLFDSDKNLLSDNELENFVENTLNSVFTLTGLKNLIGDFLKLEERLKEEFKDNNLKFITNEVTLVGKTEEKNEKGEDIWTVGTPDLLVVDSKGIVHPVDFKTKIIHIGDKENEGYDRAIDNGSEDAEDYGKQVTRYIRLLESHGLTVDQSARVVLIDTWYNRFDKTTTDEKDQTYEIGKPDANQLRKLEIKGEAVKKDKNITLGEYAASIPNYTRNDLATDLGQIGVTTPLYLEPRLHVKLQNNKFTDELNALHTVPTEDNVGSYERQYNSLTQEERGALQWLAGVPLPVREIVEDIKTLSGKGIKSRPDLIGSQEIKELSEAIMYEVSSILNRLERGEYIEEFPLSKHDEGKVSPLSGKSHKEIITLISKGGRFNEGLNHLLNYAFDKLILSKCENEFPTKEEYENDDYDEDYFEFEDEQDYLNQKELYDKAMWLSDNRGTSGTHNREELLREGFSKLIALEDCVIPIKDNKNDILLHGNSDNISLNSGSDAFFTELVEKQQDGISELEAWMLGQRNYSPKVSLAKEIKRIFESLYEKDSNGKDLRNSYGWSYRIHLDTTMAIQTVLEACRYCNTFEDMEAILTVKAKLPQNKWISDLLDKVKSNKNLKAKFYRNFKKDALTYCISRTKLDKKTGKQIIDNLIINLKSAYATIKQSLNASFYNGNVGSYYLGNDKKAALISKERTSNTETLVFNEAVARAIDKTAEQLLNTKLPKLYNKHSRTSSDYVDAIKQEFEDNSIIKIITNMLNGIGIMIPEDVVFKVCFADDKISRNTGNLVNNIKSVVSTLRNNKNKIANGLSGNPAFRQYDIILRKVADFVQEHVEANSYEDGKTWYTYTNPSRLGYIINNLKDGLQSANDKNGTFNKFLNRMYGRYDWFKNKNGKWNNSLLEKLTEEQNKEEIREALAHKVELSFLGTKYRDLGELGFQLSILRNYWGTSEDSALYKSFRWFALPTMSNKPVNEFVRLPIYTDNYKQQIIDDVLMRTFDQEVSRIADVLWHYRNSSTGVDLFDLHSKGDKKLKEVLGTTDDVAEFKKRIDDHMITATDLRHLARITSGAKFHFLWYLNDETLNNESFANELARVINNRLTRDSEQNLNLSTEVNFRNTVRELISKNMENVVEKEVDHMREIGLFETEKRIVGKGKNRHEISVYKYQEVFGGKLGLDREDYIAKYREKSNTTPSEEEILEKLRKDMTDAVTEFVWQDIAANINIIQLTGGDLAYFGNSVNYQKRIAMEHSPGLKMMSDPEFDDGYLRSIHISDDKVREEIKSTIEYTLEEYLENNKNSMSSGQQQDYKSMIKILSSAVKKTKSTDGQSFDSPSSMRKKLRMMGEWTSEHDEAYEAISKGDFDINHLGIFAQPIKPLVASDVAKYSGSPTTQLRKVPIQEKNSEYLIILAEALARGSKKRSKLVAICDFMEETHKDGDGKHGIDTCHFESVNKVGKSGIIDLNTFDKVFDEQVKKGVIPESSYAAVLKAYLWKHVRPYDTSKTENKNKELSLQTQKEWDDLTSQNDLEPQEKLYNPVYVDTIPVSDYIQQQEVPAHFLDKKGQLYGSQIRILGISDITPGTMFDVRGNKVDAEKLIEEYKQLHADNINDALSTLLKELGLDKFDEINKKLSILTKQQYIKENNLEGQNELDIQNAYNTYVEESIFKSVAELPTTTEYAPIRNEIYRNLEFILKKELAKDTRYGSDVEEACTLEYDALGNVIDFKTPLMDPIQSKRIQMLLNSIIKNRINKQRISGGSVVQTTAYDNDLHIRFKGDDGKELDNFPEWYKKHYGKDNWQDVYNEDDKSIANKDEIINKFKAYLKENNASIAYFECFITIPNIELERLLTNPDGSMMSYEEAKEILKDKPELWKSLTEIIGYRIPTEDKYSMLPLKIVGFLPKAAGQVIMMPQEITYLTGSDFDIDKMYIMRKDFNLNLTNTNDDKAVESIVDKYFNSNEGKKFDKKRFLAPVARLIMNNYQSVLAGDTNRNSTTGVRRDSNYDMYKSFADWYRNYILQNGFEELTNVDSKHYRERKSARNNRILDLQWAVLTNADTMSKMLNPGNFNEQKKVGRFIKIIKNKVVNNNTGNVWTWSELNTYFNKLAQKSFDDAIDSLDALLENTDQHSTTLPSSKIYFQHQNMQGTQMVGIFANNNVSHAFCSFQRIGIDLQKEGLPDRTFYLDGELIGNHSDPTMLDKQLGKNGQLISKTIASFLAASVDTAKDPTLADMNINTFTGGVAMLLARLGYDTEVIGLVLSQPVIVKLSELYFKKKTDGFYDSSTAIRELAHDIGMDEKILSEYKIIQDPVAFTKENLIRHLNDDVSTSTNDDVDFQKRVLILFNNLSQMSRNLQDLTFCTKFNSVTNAVGPTIADTFEDVDKVKKFFDDIEKSCFFTDSDDRYTSPTEVIENDPILKAFYDATLGRDGASEKIFQHFFPHYLPGFNQVKEHLQKYYLEGKKINAKLYNQLLDEYIYFLLTYRDSNFDPVLPTSRQDKDILIKQIIDDFNVVKSIKGRKYNVLLDGNLGRNRLYVRYADDFLSQSLLSFNSGQLDVDGQEKIKDAWSDLITMNDRHLSDEDNTRIRRFATDLFFYTLMKNGFGFSPKTLMHVASVVVRQMATYSYGYSNYITGLRNLRELDNYLINKATDTNYIDRFLNQFMRNHANDKKIIPNISDTDAIQYSSDDKSIVFAANDDESYKLKRIMQGANPLKYITVTRKEGNKLYRDLYMLNENYTPSEADKIMFEYTKTSRLGMNAEFIEYDANSDLSLSYFEDTRGLSDEELNDENQSSTDNREESTDNDEIQSRSLDDYGTIRSIFKNTTGKLHDKNYRNKIMGAYAKVLEDAANTKTINNIIVLFRHLLDAKSQEEQNDISEQISKEFDEQNSCFNIK